MLAEMLREAERVIDRQLEAMARLDRKSERMLALAIAALAGGVVLGTLVLQRSGPVAGLPFLIGMVAGGSANVLGLQFLLDAHVGWHSQAEWHIGASLTWIAAKSNTTGWSLNDHYPSQLADFPHYHDHNARLVAAASAHRTRGLYLILGAITAYAASFLNMLWSVTLG